MSSTQNLNKVLSELRFSEKEKEGFTQALMVAKDYLRNGDIDMEKQFKSIVEKVAASEIQED